MTNQHGNTPAPVPGPWNVYRRKADKQTWEYLQAECERSGISPSRGLALIVREWAKTRQAAGTGEPMEG